MTMISRFKAELAGQIITAVTGALATILLARLLGPDGYGLLALVLSIFAVMKIFSKLGIGKSGARYIAEYKGTNQLQINNIVKSSFIMSVFAISIVSVFVFLGAGVIAEVVNEPEIVGFLEAGVLFVIFGTFVTYSRRILQGFEKIHLSAFVQITFSVLKLVLALAFVLLGFGALGAFWGYIIGSTVAGIAGIAIIYYIMNKKYPSSESIEEGLFRRIGEYSIPITMSSTANIVDKEVDTILVGYFLNPIAVSYYVVSKQVVRFIETPMKALGFTLSPTFGTQKAEGRIDKAARTYEQALVKALLLYIPAGAGLVLVSRPTIQLVFGPDYLGAVPVLQVLAIYAVLQSITKITSNALDFLGRAKARAIVKGVTSISNAVLNIILIPVIGVVGAAIATVITYSLYTFANLYIINMEFDLRVRHILHNTSIILLISILMSTVVFLASGYITGLASLTSVVILGVIIWGGLAIVAGLLDPKEVIDNI